MFPNSIRSKLLLWLAFLLVGLLIGFGVTAYELFRTNQNHQIYAQMQRRLSAVASDLSIPRDRPPGRFGGPERGRPGDNPFDKPPTEAVACETNLTTETTASAATNEAGGPEPGGTRFPHNHSDDFSPPPPPDGFGEPNREMPEPIRQPRGPRHDSGGADGLGLHMEPPSTKLSTEALNLFDQSNPNAFYFIVWNRAGVERLRSSNAPAGLEIASPVERAGGPQVRMHGEYLESFLQHAMGYRVLVGRSIAPELAARRHFALWLVAAGVIVLTMGLFGSWWLAGRALRPVHNISAAASRISAGNLAERIDVAETDNELGQLATTLNSTFARLESAFTQQQQFTADASHELRTPLAVMISEAQTTLARPRTENEYRETVEACLTAAQQMRKLTESLLELARYDSGQENIQRAPFDLANLVREGANLLGPLATQRGVRIETDISAAPSAGDADRIRQVVINLISNAIYYNKPDGHVRVTTRSSASEAVLTVEDNGIGIAPEDLTNVFKRFYRADKARSRANSNSGLGLSICKAIVDAHGGQITVTSKLGEGSAFTLHLPLDRTPVTASA